MTTNKKKFEYKADSPAKMQDRVVAAALNVEPVKSSKIIRNITGRDNVTTKTLNYHDEVYKLYGQKKETIKFFVNRCIAIEKTNTGPITLNDLSDYLKTTKKNVHSLIDKLVKSGLIRRKLGKKGNGGFSIFELEDRKSVV